MIFNEHPAQCSPVKGVALCAHGINLHPKTMNDLANVLCAEGYSAVILSLAEHIPDKGIKKFEAKDWLDDIEQAYIEKIKNHPGQKIFVGFSLGSLLGLYARSIARVKFDKYIFLAPAWKVYWYVHILRLLRYFPGLPIFSLGLKTHRARSYLPMFTYNALFSFLDSLPIVRTSIAEPCLIVLDPKDPLVPCKKIKKFASENFQNAEVFELHRKKLRQYSGTNHLFLDQLTTFEEEWTKIKDKISAFLN